MALGFYINNAECYGCKTCQLACITTRLPGNRKTFMRNVRDILADEPRAYSFLSLACNHCASPRCLANCPQGAYSKQDNGLVIQDHDACIGCKTCIDACPYSAPVFDEAEGKTYKCDMCQELISAGGQPACVAACPGLNLAFGELDVLQSDNPGAAAQIRGVTPDASETQPSIAIVVDPALV